MIGDGPELSAQGLTNLHRMEQMLANGDAPSAQQNGDTTHQQQQHGECSDPNDNLGFSSFPCIALVNIEGVFWHCIEASRNVAK